MSKQKENQLRESIHRLLNRNVVHQEKMNNPFRSGTFDDWYSAKPTDLWVEAKFQPVFGSVRANLSSLQFHWGTQRFKEKRHVAVIVGLPQGILVLRQNEWEKRIPNLEVEQRLLKRKQYAELLTLFVTSSIKPNEQLIDLIPLVKNK